jgi:hypothetical protein
MKLQVRLFTALLFFYAFPAHADVCVEVVNKDLAFHQALQNPTITKEDKKIFSNLISDEKELLEEFATQVVAYLDKTPEFKKLSAVLQAGCLVINHGPIGIVPNKDPKEKNELIYPNELMAYSAETDPYYVYAQEGTRLYHPKNNPEATVRMNVTESFIKLLAYAKKERGDSDEIQPGVLGYAGSFLIRNAAIASQTVKASFPDIRKKNTAIMGMGENGLNKWISGMETKVGYEKNAMDLQQTFIDGFKNEISEWFGKVSRIHPEFFKEKALWLEIVNDVPAFVTKTETVGDKTWKVFFDGQHRVPFLAKQIVSDAGLLNALRGKSTPEEIASAGFKQEIVEDYKIKIQGYMAEWKIYINDSTESKDILQAYIMNEKLKPFIAAYDGAFLPKDTNVGNSPDMPELFTK